MDELLDFTGKTALVTGGSRGLGREMALALAAARRELGDRQPQNAGLRGGGEGGARPGRGGVALRLPCGPLG